MHKQLFQIEIRDLWGKYFRGLSKPETLSNVHSKQFMIVSSQSKCQHEPNTRENLVTNMDIDSNPNWNKNQFVGNMCFCKGNGPGLFSIRDILLFWWATSLMDNLFFEKNYVTTACFILNDAESSQFISAGLAWMGICWLPSPNIM